MDSNQLPLLTEQIHHLLNVRAGLFLARAIVLSLVYYLLTRWRLGEKIFHGSSRFLSWLLDRSTFRTGEQSRHLIGAAAVFTTALVLMLPLAIGVAAERYSFRIERNLTKTGIFQLEQFDWLLKNGFPTVAEILFVGVMLALYWIIDNFHELRALNRRQSKELPEGKSRQAVKGFIHARAWIARCCAKFARYCVKARRVRQRVQLCVGYYLAFNLAIVSLMFLIINTETSGQKELLDSVPVKAMPDSAQSAMIRALATKAGVGALSLNVAYVSGLTPQMNATGRYKVLWGAKITIYDTTLDGLTRAELLFIVGHELYHVTQLSIRDATIIVLILSTLAMLICFGVPRRRSSDDACAIESEAVVLRFVLVLPRYLCLGIAAWLFFQVASCALQRAHEAEADRFAVRLTVPESVSLAEARSALTKVNQSGINDPSPPWTFQLFFNDHPSLTERLRNLEDATR